MKKGKRFLIVLVSFVLLFSSYATIPDHAVAANHLSDASFFGVWNGTAWTTAGKLDYSYNGGALSAVESKVKNGDYAGAKAELLLYFQNRTNRATPPQTTGNKRVADLAVDRTFIGPAADELEDEITVTAVTYASVTADVTRSVSGNLGDLKPNTVSYMIMGKEKGAGIAQFYSREHADAVNRPQLDVIIGGNTYTIEASKDAYIVGDSAANYGAGASLLAAASGYPYDTGEHRAYITFDLASLPKGVAPSYAQLRLYGTNQSGGSQILYVFFTGNTAYSETEINWFNTLGNIYSWHGAPGGTDWDQPDYADVEYVNVLNRFTFALPMAYEYSLNPAETHYSASLIQLWTDFIADREAGYPRSLETGIRSDLLLRSYHIVRSSSAMSAEANAEIVKFFWQEAEYLADPANFHRDGNFGVLESSGLYRLGVYFPEFVQSGTWQAIAETRLQYMLTRSVLTDYSFSEAATAYASWVLGTYSAVMSFAQLNGQSFSPTFQETVRQFAYYLMNAAAPDGSDVVYGDSDVNSYRTMLYDFGNKIDDDGLLYFGSGGTEGTMPAHTSALYPYGMIAMMRSGWAEDDLYMHMANGRANSHGHSDLLSVVMYGYDKQLLIDPGRYNYSGDSVSSWLKSTAAHNTLMVDDSSLSRHAPLKQISRWETVDGFDFVEGSHNGYNNVLTTRSILFVKPEFWIVSDTAAPSSGNHAYEQLWHFLPNANPAADSVTGRVYTNFDSGANLQLIPADPAVAPPQLKEGYFSPSYGVATTAAYASFVQENASGPVSFDTVVYPTRAGDNREVTVTRLAVFPAAPATTATAIQIDTDKGGAGNYGYYYLSKEPVPGASRSFDAFTFDGKMAYIEQSKGGSLQAVSLLDGSRLQQASNDLVSSTVPIPRLYVQWDGTDLHIDGEGLVPSRNAADGIAIWAPTASDVILNGESVSFARAGNYIYAARYEVLEQPGMVATPRVGATASSAHNTNWSAANAVDNRNNTAWSSAKNNQAEGNEWLYVDMGANYDVQKVALVPRSSDGTPVGFPSDFKLQYSVNAVDWSDVPGQSYARYPAPTNLQGEAFQFQTAVNARYIRVLASRLNTDAFGDYYMQLAEIYPYTTSHHLDRHNVQVSSTLSSAFGDYKLYDDDAGSAWSSQRLPGATGSEWISVDMGGLVNLNALRLVPRSSGDSIFCFPVDFKFQSSEDGENWTDIPGQTYTNYPNPTKTTGETFAFDNPVPARHVRVLATKFRSDQYGSYYMQLAELYAYGSANSARGKSVTATSSYEQSNWGTARAVDGFKSLTSGGWSSNNQTGSNHSEWVQIDLGDLSTVSRVDLYPVNTGYGFPINLNILTSVDGTNWTTAVSSTNEPVPGVCRTYTFQPQEARYVRIHGTNLRANPNDANQYRMQFAEIEVFGRPNKALGAAVAASSSYEQSNWGKSNAVNGSTGSTSGGWSSNDQTGSNHAEWIQMDLGAVKSVGQAELYPVNSGYGFPIDLKIWASQDGVNWRAVIQSNNEPIPTASRLYTFSPVQARYIKVEGTNLRANPNDANQYRMQFAEVEIR